jgi:hypothetical protein
MGPKPRGTLPQGSGAKRAETIAAPATPPPPPSSPSYLLVFEASSSRMVPLPRDGLLRVGRAAEAEVSLDDASASRLHAQLRITDGTVVVEDLGSRNGTLVNGQRVQEPRLLTSGDTISVSHVSLVLHAVAAPAAGGRLVDLAQFTGRATEELDRARRCGRALSIIVVRLAPATADRAAVVGAVGGALRPMELAAWTGLGEIAVLVPEQGAAEAQACASAVREGLAALGGEVAAGCATYAADGCDLGALLANARAAATTPAGESGTAAGRSGRSIRIGD